MVVVAAAEEAALVVEEEGLVTVAAWGMAAKREWDEQVTVPWAVARKEGNSAPPHKYSAAHPRCRDADYHQGIAQSVDDSCRRSSSGTDTSCMGAPPRRQN